MYLEYYQLKDKPFQITPDPKFLWMSETHREALAVLKYGIMDNRGLLLLQGDIGTGKTTLINALLESLDDRVIVSSITDPGLETLDFYNFIASAFKMGRKFSDKGDFLVKFIHFLHKAYAQNQQVLLIVDEAQRLSHELLEEIRQLSNIERKDRKLLNIFLVGQNEIGDLLMEPDNRAFKQRITTFYRLGPLKRSEVKEYIRFRLHVAGTDQTIFTSAAIRRIADHTEGYPRVINVLCDRAMITGYSRDKKRIDVGIINECIKDLDISVRRRPKVPFLKRFLGGMVRFFKGAHPASVPALILLMAALGIGVGYRYFYHKITPSVTTTSVAEIQKTTVPRVTQNAMKPIPHATVPQVPDTASETMDTPASADPVVPAVVVKKPVFPVNNKTVIHFTYNSNEFPPDAYQRLKPTMEVIKAFPDAEVLIRGYTDSVGPVDYNKQLSEFRANMIKSYMVGQGVDPKRIKVYGMGPADPIMSNTTPVGRTANRRVEIELTRPSGS